MIYLLDTDLFIFLVRGLKPARRPAQRERARKLAERCQRENADGNSVALSAVTVSELEYGARNSGDDDKEMAAVRKALAPFDVYDYDALHCPAHYGQIRHDLEAKGTTIGSMDLLIAAHALALDATLVSNNLARFNRVAKLKTANWLAR